MARVRTQLKRTSDGRTIPATLEDALPRAALFDIEAEWCRERVEIARQLDAAGVGIGESGWPESWHWNWASKAMTTLPGAASPTAVSLFGVRAERQWQAAMLCLTDRTARLAPRRAPLVYIDYVEVAPWSWDIAAIGRRGRYRGAGLLMMTSAIRLSLSLGLAGRIGLHSLAQTESYYAGRFGMRNLGADPRYHGLTYFEMTAAQAQTFLRGSP